MDEQNKGVALEDQSLQDQIRELAEVALTHQAAIKHAVESLQQAARGTIGLTQVRDLAKALETFTPTKNGLEKAKRLIKAKVQAELKDL